MGYVIPAGYSRVTVEFGAQSPLGSAIVTGFGVSLDPGAILLDNVKEWLDDNYQPLMQSFYSIDRIEARNDVAVEELAVNIPGALAGDPSPPSVAALAKITSGLPGRKNRGRMYLPGLLLDADVDASGGIDSTALNNIQTCMDALGEKMGLIDAEIVILHSDVGTPTLATGVQVQGIAATQRRRLRR